MFGIDAMLVSVMANAARSAALVQAGYKTQQLPNEAGRQKESTELSIGDVLTAAILIDAIDGD